MEYMKLNPKAVTSWRISRSIWLAICVLVCVTAVIISFAVQGEAGFPVGLYVSAAAAILVLYKLVGLIVYPKIEYRQWGYHIAEDKVVIRHGIFFVTNTVIPIIRIQHITVKQGPIGRRLGLYDVEISLASGSFEIVCLEKSVADEISENLKSRLYVRLEAEK